MLIIADVIIAIRALLLVVDVNVLQVTCELQWLSVCLSILQFCTRDLQRLPVAATDVESQLFDVHDCKKTRDVGKETKS